MFFYTLTSNPFLNMNLISSLAFTTTSCTKLLQIPASNSQVMPSCFSQVRMNPLNNSRFAILLSICSAMSSYFAFAFLQVIHIDNGFDVVDIQRMVICFISCNEINRRDNTIFTVYFHFLMYFTPIYFIIHPSIIFQSFSELPRGTVVHFSFLYPACP